MLFGVDNLAANRLGVKREPITYKGRSIGILVLVGAQLFIGAIHALFGVLLFSFGSDVLPATYAYDVYTLAFGLLVCVFAWYIWQGKRAGWVGTVAVSVFVTVADALVVLGLPSIPGIPLFAAPTEIVYSIVVIGYLFTEKVRKKLGVS